MPEQYDLGKGIIGVPDPVKFAAARNGARFVCLIAGQNSLWVVVERCRILCFQIVRRRDNGEYGLYLWEL